ncbi:hypothetical protein [Stenotrophomonas pigmentata]|uniref:hypothetical protein n=1 Tax=Stenotrophomonas pigmentata TaxID=3055080 RepID=UPI0026EA286C|nr:hypothetical protein [Stenotrophomonas sp. 610A2]
MIMHDIPPSQRLTHDACGHTAHLIETRGRVQIDPRLFGKPARQYHVECTHCGVATPPVYSQRIAEHLWGLGETALIPLTQLPALRIAAERSLLAA